MKILAAYECVSSVRRVLSTYFGSFAMIVDVEVVLTWFVSNTNKVFNFFVGRKPHAYALLSGLQ